MDLLTKYTPDGKLIVEDPMIKLNDLYAKFNFDGTEKVDPEK